MKSISSADQLAKIILDKAKSNKPLVVAVDGFGGSGKTTLCKKLSKILPDSMIIQTDDFIVYPHQPDDFAHNWTAIENVVLKRIKTSSKIETKTYDWNTLGPKSEINPVQNIVLIEGIGLLDEKYSKYFDLKVWIDCPFEIAKNRGKIRDKEEQGVDHDHLWDNEWGPGAMKYFNKVRPDLRADIHFLTKGIQS